MRPSSLTRLIRAKARELGFELVGAIPVSRSKTIDVYNSWLKKGYAGSMTYLERHAELKEDPRRLLPETMSLLALGFNYKTVDPSEKVNNPDIGCIRSEEHTSELQSQAYLVCRLLLAKKNYIH